MLQISSYKHLCPGCFVCFCCRLPGRPPVGVPLRSGLQSCHHPRSAHHRQEGEYYTSLSFRQCLAFAQCEMPIYGKVRPNLEAFHHLNFVIVTARVQNKDHSQENAYSE